MQKIKKNVIVVAGGSGQRMNSAIPKQFLLLKGKPVLMHTIERFFEFDKDIKIILVLPENQIAYWKGLVTQFNCQIHHTIVIGGQSRFHSVKNGLAEVENNTLVAIHDGVRPLIITSVIQEAFEVAFTKGNAIPAISVNDSMRLVNDNGNSSVNRDQFRIVQTPQTFMSELIKKAFLQEYSPAFTDDASVLESTGANIHLINGDRKNIKITSPEDLLIAEALIK